MPKKRTSRRARGTGSIFFHDGRQRWVGRKVVDGVRVERWGLTQAEVVKKLDMVGPADARALTVAGWAARWRDTLSVRESTKHDYLVSIDQHVLPALGHLKLSAVTTSHIEALITKLSATTAPGTCRKIITHARILFAAASRADIVPKNVVANARKPRGFAPEIQTLTTAQLQTIIAVAPKYESGGVIATLAACGARIGEVLALDLGDWNPAAKTLSITKSYSLRFGIGPPKSRHSRRTISVPDILVPLLKAAVDGRTEGPLFPTASGARRNAQAVWDAWQSITRVAKTPRVKIHALRHSVATMLIGAGVPIPDCARFIGDTSATLVKVYLHATGANPTHTLNDLYGGQKVGENGSACPEDLKTRAFSKSA